MSPFPFFIWQSLSQEVAAADGTVTVYSRRVPKEAHVEAHSISAWGNAGTNNELTRVGIEVQGVKHYLDYEKLTATDEVLSRTGRFFAKENDRFFAEFEAANTGEILHLCVNGIWYPKS
ncbi:hypothetical protein ES703_101334 [subsurface metagenome]